MMMDRKEEVIKQKIRELAEGIRSTYFEDKEKYGIYEAIYGDCKDEDVKKIFSTLHKKLNSLFEFMNEKSRFIHKHYNANESRELLKIMNYVYKLKEWFEKIEYVLEIDKAYLSTFDYVKSFLETSGGSTMPLDYQYIKIEDTDPIFSLIKNNNFQVKTDNQSEITRDFAKEQLDKIDKKIIDRDYDGAITNCRSLLEDVYKEVYERKTHKKLETKGNFIKSWRQLASELNLKPEDQPSEFLRQILSGLNSINNGLASMRNQMSDSHSRSKNMKPARHHAVLAHNSALTIIDFLFGTLEHQKNINKND